MQFMSHGETKWMARILEVIGGVKEKGMSINRCHMEEKGEWTCVPEYPDLEPPKEDKKNPPREDNDIPIDQIRTRKHGNEDVVPDSWQNQMDRYSANSAFNLLAPSTRRISSGVWVPMIRDDFGGREVPERGGSERADRGDGSGVERDVPRRESSVTRERGERPERSGSYARERVERDFSDRPSLERAERAAPSRSGGEAPVKELPEEYSPRGPGPEDPPKPECCCCPPKLEPKPVPPKCDSPDAHCYRKWD